MPPSLASSSSSSASPSSQLSLSLSSDARCASVASMACSSVSARAATDADGAFVLVFFFFGFVCDDEDWRAIAALSSGILSNRPTRRRFAWRLDASAGFADSAAVRTGVCWSKGSTPSNAVSEDSSAAVRAGSNGLDAGACSAPAHLRFDRGWIALALKGAGDDASWSRNTLTAGLQLFDMPPAAMGLLGLLTDESHCAWSAGDECTSAGLPCMVWPLWPLRLEPPSVLADERAGE